MKKAPTPTQPARRLATCPRTERSELRFVQKELFGHSFVEISVWTNKRGRMRPTSSVTIRRGAELEAALAALSDFFLLTKDDNEESFSRSPSKEHL